MAKRDGRSDQGGLADRTQLTQDGSYFVTNVRQDCEVTDASRSLTVSRDGDAIVVRIPVRFHRSNDREMVLAHGGNGNVAMDRENIGTLDSALAKAYR